MEKTKMEQQLAEEWQSTVQTMSCTEKVSFMKKMLMKRKFTYFFQRDDFQRNRQVVHMNDCLFTLDLLTYALTNGNFEPFIDKLLSFFYTSRFM